MISSSTYTIKPRAMPLDHKHGLINALSLQIPLRLPLKAVILMVILSASNLPLPSYGTAIDSLPTLQDQTVLQENEYEYTLGRAWLRALHSRTRTLDDPLVKDYLNYLVYQLLPFSELQDRRVDTVIVDQRPLNAFAVPGGIIGINAGLFLYGEDEHEFAAVISHEIAHLSQRHFARGQENNQRTQTATLAQLFAGILLAAAGGGDAGFALIASSQASAYQSMLAFSRQGEREADRIGIKILAEAGLDPKGMPRMFERMHIATRYSKTPPEYLSTHPITNTRITDAASRADLYPKQKFKSNLEYELIKRRVELHFADSASNYLKNLNVERKKIKGQISDDLTYAYAIAHIKNKSFGEAQQYLSKLSKKEPQNILYITTQAELDIANNQPKRAISRLKDGLDSNPNNFPLSITLAKALEKNQQYSQAESTLKKLSQSQPLDPHIWYELAEVRGLSKNILGVHEARAEYFFVTGTIREGFTATGSCAESSNPSSIYCSY